MRIVIEKENGFIVNVFSPEKVEVWVINSDSGIISAYNLENIISSPVKIDRMINNACDTEEVNNE